MQKTPSSQKSKKSNFAIQYRMLLGWTTILMVIGSYGAYLFHLKSPQQQHRLSTLKEERQKRVNLTSLIHRENIKNQKGHADLKTKKTPEKKRRIQQLNTQTATAFDPVFQTTIQTAPNELEVQAQTINTFTTHEAIVSEDQSVPKVSVAFKPIDNVEDIETNFEDDEEISGEIAEDTNFNKTEKKPAFAVQLITSRSLYVIEEKWYELKEIDQGNILEELQPKFTITEISKEKKDYTLLAGPFQTASQAVKLCKQLKKITDSCSEALYKGHDLFQFDPEQDFPVSSLGSDGAPPIR